MIARLRQRVYSLGWPLEESVVFGEVVLKHLTFTLDSAQSFERGFLSLGQTFYAGDIHTFIGPLASQCFLTFSCVDVPEFDRAIITPTGYNSSIWVESDGPDPTAMTCQDFKTLTRGNIPDTDSLIVATADKHSSIWTECD